MAQCPRCKEEMPLLSKVCPVCGYVMNDGDDSPTAEELVNRLEELLLRSKNMPKPSFAASLRNMLFVLFLVLALYFVVLALISEAGLFWLLGIACGVVALYLLVRKLTKRTISAGAFERLKNEYEYQERLARRSFGKNIEVSRLIKEITSEINAVEAEHLAARRRSRTLWLVFAVVVIVVAAGGIFSTDLASRDEAPATEQSLPGGESSGEAAAEGEAAPWKARVAAFAASSDNSEYGDNAARLSVLDEILKYNAFDAAEEFFFTYCQGKMGDLECARKVVGSYLAADRKADAAAFAGRVALRYASDTAKLKKMVE